LKANKEHVEKDSKFLPSVPTGTSRNVGRFSGRGKQDDISIILNRFNTPV